MFNPELLVDAQKTGIYRATRLALARQRECLVACATQCVFH